MKLHNKNLTHQKLQTFQKLLTNRQKHTPSIKRKKKSSTLATTDDSTQRSAIFAKFDTGKNESRSAGPPDFGQISAPKSSASTIFHHPRDVPLLGNKMSCFSDGFSTFSLAFQRFFTARTKFACVSSWALLEIAWSTAMRMSTRLEKMPKKGAGRAASELSVEFWLRVHAYSLRTQIWVILFLKFYESFAWVI